MFGKKRIVKKDFDLNVMNDKDLKLFMKTYGLNDVTKEY